MSGNGNTARQKKDAKMGNKEKRSAARDRIPGEKTRGSPPRKNLPPPLLVPPTRQEGGGGGEMWPRSFKFMQCSLMMLCCVRALCYAKRRVATLLIALHKLQHLTGAALPFFFPRSLARCAMWTAGDKLECVQSVQQIKWLHMFWFFFREGSGVDIIKSEKASAVHELFR